MNAEVLGAIAGCAGVLVALGSLLVASKANRRAEEANELARGANTIATEANDLSKDANKIAEKALDSSERIGRDQIALHQRELDLIHEAERRQRSADLCVSPSMRTSHGVFKIKVENRGPGHADRLTLSLLNGDQSMPVGRARNLAPGGTTEFEGNRGPLLMGATDQEVDDPSRSEGQVLELHLNYVDGNGPQLIQKRVTISPGTRFVDRQWSIEN